MTESHPVREALQRFMRGELTLEERREIVRHLLGGCTRCVAQTRSLWSLGEGADRLRPPTLAVIHAASAEPEPNPQPRQEHRLAAIRLIELYELPPPERSRRIAEDQRFHLAALCRLLLQDTASWAGASDRIAAAELAAGLAERLDTGHYGAAKVAALALRAWTESGLARRASADLAGAEGALEAALRHLLPELHGTRAEARLLELRALLHLDREQPAEAERTLAHAVSIHRSLGGGRRLGRALVQQGVVRSRLGDARAPLAAAILLKEGLEVLNAEADPRSSACALHWLGLLRAEAGAEEEALSHFTRARRLYSQAGDLENRARVWFAEGVLEADRGRNAEADRALLAAEQEFVAIGSGRSAAQTLVQRSLLRLRQPETLPLRSLGSGVLPILRCRDLSRGDAAALVLFRRLVESEQATTGLLSEVLRFLAGRQTVRRPTTECAL